MNSTQEIQHFSAKDCQKMAVNFAIDKATTEHTLRRLGIGGYSARNIRAMLGRQGMDSLSPELATQASTPTPVQFLQAFTPEIVHTVTAVRDIDDLVGKTIVGSWEDEQVVQTVIERTGQPRPYSDSASGTNASWNANFIVRDVARFEEDFEIGILEELQSAKARINSAAEKREAVAEALEIDRNDIGFNGYSSGSSRIYGLLNDPNLPDYVSVTTNAAGTSTSWEHKTFMEIQADILLMISSLQNSTKNRYNPKRDNATLVIALAAEQYLEKSKEYGSETVAEWLSRRFPLIQLKSTVYFNGANGGANIAYLYAEKIGNSRVVDQYVQETLRFLGVFNKGKTYEEQYANATSGVMVRVPVGICRVSGI